MGEMEIVQTRALNPNATSLVTAAAILQSMLLISSALAGSLNTQMEHEIQRPPGIAITSSINADDLFSITLGNAPNTCMCQRRACDFYRCERLRPMAEFQDYGSNTTARCNFYSISGAITAVSGRTTCYIPAPTTSGAVYPADAFLSSFTTSPGAGAVQPIEWRVVHDAPIERARWSMVRLQDAHHAHGERRPHVRHAAVAAVHRELAVLRRRRRLSRAS